jgi:hypothetical protein
VDLASGAIYTSGTFWAFAGVVAVVLSTVVLALVTLRAANPRRPVLYWTGDTTPLLDKHANLPQLKVSMRLRSSRRRWNPYGQALKSPHIVKVGLISKGRTDITPASFGGSPLRLDVGAPVVEFLSVATVPGDRQVPRVRADGTTLLVEPVLIGKRESINISMLVDGESPVLSRPQQLLIDVDIRQWDPGAENARLQNRLIIIIGLLLIAVILGLPGALQGIIAFFNSL